MIIGTILIMVDMKFGILSLLMFGLSSLMVIGLIVGIIAGGVKDGILSVLGALVLSVLLITLLMPFLYQEWAQVLLYPDAFIPLVMVFVAMWMMHQSYTLGVLGQHWYTVYMLPEGEATLITMIMTPFIFGIGLVFGGIGGFIGKRFLFKPKPDKEAEPLETESAPEESAN
jgi:hypothetical protein